MEKNKGIWVILTKNLVRVYWDQEDCADKATLVMVC